MVTQSSAVLKNTTLLGIIRRQRHQNVSEYSQFPLDMQLSSGLTPLMHEWRILMSELHISQKGDEFTGML